MSLPESRKPSTGNKPAAIPTARRLEPAQFPTATPANVGPLNIGPINVGPAVNAGPPNFGPAVNIGPPANGGGWSGPAAVPAGTMAQKLRLKNIKEAMYLLLIAGVVNIAWGGFLWWKLEADVAAAGKVFDLSRNTALRSLIEKELAQARILLACQVSVGVIFVALALAVKRAPLITTATALGLYLAVYFIFGVINPVNFYMGFIGKIFLVVALATAVRSASSYEKQKKKMAEAAAR